MTKVVALPVPTNRSKGYPASDSDTAYQLQSRTTHTKNVVTVEATAINTTKHEQREKHDPEGYGYR